MEIYSSIEYETIILTITKLTVWERKFIWCKHLYSYSHCGGLCDFCGNNWFGLFSWSELSYSILFRRKRNIYIYIFRLMEVRSGVENWSIILPDLLTFGAILSMRLWWFVAIVNMIYLQWLFVKALNCHQPLSFNANEMNKKVWKCH